MPLVEWSNAYEVGVEKIDAQHRQLCILMNEMHDAMAQGKGRAVTGKALDGLIAYTIKHFSDEEITLQLYGYPELPKHRLIHREFMAAVEGFQKQYRAGSLTLNIDMMKYLRHWLLNHIQGTDKVCFAAVQQEQQRSGLSATSAAGVEMVRQKRAGEPPSAGPR